jgi:hypothetical protein
MWSLNNWKIVFAAVGLIGVLLFCLPSVASFVRVPYGERFSELYVLGPTHKAEGYPFNVSDGSNYLVVLGVDNHLGKSAFYEVQVKLRNSEDPLPNSTSSVASSLPILYTYRVFLGDGQVWEDNLSFSLKITFLGNIVGATFNGVSVNVTKTAAWDSVNSGYFYELFMELWLFNTTSNAFSFDNRFVGFWLNMTAVP